MKNILALACFCVDYFPEKDTAHVGGNALNVAVNCAKTNKANVYIMGNVGNDTFGEQIKTKADEYKINRDYLFTVNGETASNKIYLTAEGDRYFKDDSWTNGVLSDFNISAESEAFIKSMNAVATTMNDRVLPQLVEIKRSSSFLLSIDFMEHIPSEKWCEYFSVLDLFFISGRKEDLPLFKKWSIEYKTIFAATLGAEGSVAFKNGEEYFCDAVKVEEVIDTTGCGDSFQAAFITDYLHNNDILSAMKAGAESAANTLSFMGAI